MISEFGIQLDLNVLEVQVTLLESSKKNKSLCTNHPCAFCDTHGNYSYQYPKLYYFHNALPIIREMDVTHNDPPLSLLVALGTNSFLGKVVAQTSIVIPPNVEMVDAFIPIIYLSSSMGSTYSDSQGASKCVFLEPSSEDTSVSTLVDLVPTCHQSPLE